MNNQRRKWTIYIVMATAIAVLASKPVYAALIAEEQFIYGTSDTTLNGGTGFSAAWSDGASGSEIDTTGWTYTGLQTAGGRFLKDPGTNPNHYERLFDLSAGSPADNAGLISGGLIGADGTTLWMSFLVRKGNTTSDGTSADGRWPWIAHGLYTGTTDKLTVQRNEGTTSGVLSPWRVSNATRNTLLTAETDPFTFFLFKIEYGNGAFNDALSVWMNWNLANGEPDPNVDTPDFFDSFTDFSFDRLKLRGGGAGNPDLRVMFDEFRLATTYSEAIGVPEPSGFLLAAASVLGLGFFGRRRTGM